MWFLVVAMLVIVAIAGVVVLYVAFPHRGEEVPHVPWVGRLMRKGVDNAPTLDNTSEEDPGHEDWSLDLTSPDPGPSEPQHRDAS
jgi:hypothetical protein